jgi:hypothetical protein
LPAAPGDVAAKRLDLDDLGANGPETTLVRSSTLIPANGPGMAALPIGLLAEPM